MLEINKNNSNTNSSGLIINHNTSSDNNNNNNNNNNDSSTSTQPLGGGYNILAAFNNITLVGDSLTEASAGRKKWAQILANRTGATVRSFCRGGFTAKQWFGYFNIDEDKRDYLTKANGVNLFVEGSYPLNSNNGTYTIGDLSTRYSTMITAIDNINNNPEDTRYIDRGNYRNNLATDSTVQHPFLCGNEPVPFSDLTYTKFTPFSEPIKLNEDPNEEVKYNVKRPNQLAIIYLGTNDGLVRDRSNELAADNKCIAGVSDLPEGKTILIDDQLYFYRQIIQDFVDVGACILLIRTHRATAITDIPTYTNYANQGYIISNHDHSGEHYHTVEETNLAIASIVDEFLDPRKRDGAIVDQDTKNTNAAHFIEAGNQQHVVAWVDVPFLSGNEYHFKYLPKINDNRSLNGSGVEEEKGPLAEVNYDELEYDGTHYNALGYAAFVDLLIRATGDLSADMKQRLIPHSGTFESSNRGW